MAPKPKLRDLTEKDGEVYLTKSNAQLDLERRLGEDGEVKPVGPTVVNPNPLGKEVDGGQYVGTDPVYQNYANDQMKPLAAEGGPEQELEEALVDEYDTDEVDDSKVAVDPGLGGKAVKAGDPIGGRTFRTVLPGQEGYDLKKAEEQNGPPLRVYSDDEVSDSDSDSEVEDQEPVTPGGPVPPQPGNDPANPDSQSGS